MATNQHGSHHPIAPKAKGWDSVFVVVACLILVPDQPWEHMSMDLITQ